MFKIVVECTNILKLTKYERKNLQQFRCLKTLLISSLIVVLKLHALTEYI